MRLVAITFFALATLTENVAGASESADCSDQYQWCEPHDCIYSEVVAFCHKTCGLCGGGSTTDSIVSSEEETTTEVSESTVGSSESGGSCVDEYFSCSSDWCPNHANKCRKTCGLCIQPTPTRRGPVAVTVTADRTDYPEEFTTSDISETREPAIEEENICSDIFPWCRYAPCLVMGVVCRESCGFCDGTGTTTETAEVAETTEETSSTATEIETMEEDTKCSNDYNWCSDTVCKYYGTSCRQSCGLCENAQSTTEGFGIDVNSSYFTEQPSECHDEREHCNVDYCKILENMRTQCKRTCGYCDTSKTTEVPFGTTEDTQTTEAVTECNDHYGWCTDSVCKYYGNSCRKSCGLCEAEQSTLDVIETTTETEATENALECQDERHDCTEDACQFYGTSKQCRKTCGLCDMVE